MRETAGELPDRLHFLRLTQRLLRLQALGGLHGLRHDTDDLAALVPHRTQRHVESALAGRKIDDDSLLNHLAGGDAADRIPNHFRHSRSAGKPGRFPERPPTTSSSRPLIPAKRCPVCVQQDPVGGHVALIDVCRLQKRLHPVRARLERDDRPRQLGGSLLHLAFKRFR